MADNNLPNLLEKLHSQIEDIQTIGQEDQDKLRALEADIRALLERSNEQAAERQPSIFQRLEEAVNLFEATHPTLATTISDVMVVLSNAGI